MCMFRTSIGKAVRQACFCADVRGKGEEVSWAVTLSFPDVDHTERGRLPVTFPSGDCAEQFRAWACSLPAMAGRDRVCIQEGFGSEVPRHP